MKIFHHNDPDGFCAAAVARKAGKDGELIASDYRMEVPVDDIKEDEEVIIVDFSFEPDVMKKVLEKTDNVIWIDHHGTAEDYEKSYGKELDGLRNFEPKSEAGCELAWKYFFPGESAPTVVRLIGDYDKWAHRFEASKPFFEGIKMQKYVSDPASDEWQDLLSIGCYTVDSILDTIIADGKTAIRYRDQYCESMCDDYGYDTEIGGLSCFALNLFGFGSQAFGKRMTEYDACIAYIHDGKQYTVSMYSDDENTDVAKTCKDQGGGGHKNAAGFTCSALPFEPKES